MKRFPLLSAMLILLSSTCLAANEQYWFNHYQTKDGLPSNTIYAVVQDKYNFIWVATRDGICRFDGRGFVKLGDDSPNGLTSGMTPALCMDDEGGLWFANGNGVGCYNIDTGKTQSLGRLEENDIRYICQDAAGNIWFLSSNMYRYNKPSGVVSKYMAADYFAPASMTADSFGTIWVSSVSGDLYRYDNRTDQFELQEMGGINLITGTSSAAILASTAGNDVILLDPETDMVRRVFHYDEQRSILCLLERVPGEYWIGTETGVFVCSERDRTVTHIQESASDMHAISASYVMKLTADREGNVWAGTFYKGLNLWLDKRDSYQLFYVNDAPGSIRGSIVRSICPAPSGGLWIGTEDGALEFLSKMLSTNGRLPKERPVFGPVSHLTDGLSTRR